MVVSYGFRVVYATAARLDEKDFGRVAHLPFIFDERPGYHRLANQFLIDRGLGRWDPVERGKEERALLPSVVTMKNYADWLANFLEWCCRREKNPLKADYKIDLVHHYQVEMHKGIWARDNAPLKPTTINARVGIAVEFLTWAADKGLREPFEISKSVRSYKTAGQMDPSGFSGKVVQGRKGKIRENKRRLGFPPENQIFAWLQRIYLRCPTEGLMAETMLETAIRRAEMAAWRVDTLPLDPTKWKIANPEKSLQHQAVLVELMFNTKGAEYGRDFGDKIGPRGIIRVPMLLAMKLHEYRERVRPKALALALRKAKSHKEAEKIRNDSVHLFLNSKNGNRYTGSGIYEFWRSVERPQGWSPHLARDFWACSVLWKTIQDHRKLLERCLEKNINISLLGPLTQQAESCIQLIIQPQLRHASQDTTMIYLQWLSDKLAVNTNFHVNWVEKLSQEKDLGKRE